MLQENTSIYIESSSYRIQSMVLSCHFLFSCFLSSIPVLLSTPWACHYRARLSFTPILSSKQLSYVLYQCWKMSYIYFSLPWAFPLIRNCNIYIHFPLKTLVISLIYVCSYGRLGRFVPFQYGGGTHVCVTIIIMLGEGCVWSQVWSEPLDPQTWIVPSPDWFR